MVASGLLVEFAPWEKPGKRLISCKLPDGKPIEPEQEYRVAYYAGSLKNDENNAEQNMVAPAADENILVGTWEEHFISWLADMGGVIKEEPFTTKLVWE